MDSSSKEAKTKDFSTFEWALRELHNNLLKYNEDDGRRIIIAMSRKGPKLVDAVFTKEELNGLNVITEFAIPFIFKKMERGVTYHIHIVDDAVYYGSTLKNLVKEIREYGRIYGLTLRIKAYVAIIDKEALSFNEIDVEGTPGPRYGYGHYFVQQVMSLFRSKSRCMEVEYPTITYTLDKPVDLQTFEEDLRSIYGQAYRTSYKEEEVLNVLLKKDGSQFSKIRIYQDGPRLHLTYMSPFNLAIGGVYSSELFNAMGADYRQWWDKLKDCLVDNQEKSNLSDTLRRNMEKSLVVIANYIYSFQGYIYHRLDIERILSRRGYQIQRHGVSSRDIYKLVGERDLADGLTKILSYHEQVVDVKIPNWYSRAVPSEHQIYEEYDTPSIEERRTLESHNEHMIRNSRSYQEALSAVVFNQNLFVERWSRHGLQAPGRHLWFGYSHDVLLQLISRYTRLHEPISETMIHEWLDVRVDMGCVVPQYIIDHVSGQWVRVFRPGENEEIVLSHLARYVLHVYQMIDHHLNLGFVPLPVLNYILLVLHKRLWKDDLSNQFSFDLTEYDRKVVMAEPELKDRLLTVVDYLRKMYILEINDDEVSIAPRISDQEFLLNTTLDSQTTYQVDQMVKEIMQQYEAQHIKYGNCDSFFNYYLNVDVDGDFVLQYSKNIAKRVLEIVNSLLVTTYFPQEVKVNQQTQDKIIACYRDIMKYDVAPGFYLKDLGDANAFWDTYKDSSKRAQHNFKALLMIINLLVGVYVLNNFGSVRGYLNNEYTKSMMTLLRLDALKGYAETLTNELNVDKTRRNQKILIILKEYLEKISL